MYKKLFLILLALFSVLPSFAQQTYADAKRAFKREYREAHRYDPVNHSFSLQYSQVPLITRTNFNGFALSQIGNFIENSTSSLSHVYGDQAGSTRSTGTIFAEYNMIFTSGRAFSCDLGAAFFNQEIYSGIDGSQLNSKRGTVIYIVPKYKYFYLTRKNVRLYGDIGLGASLQFGFAGRLHPAFQINPFGVEVGGDKLFGTFSVGFGTLFAGGSVGIGYKL